MAAAGSSQGYTDIHEVPTVLVVGTDPINSDLESELEKLGIDVETAHPDTVVDAVIAAAPDLVLLVGDAARQEGKEVLKDLNESPAGAVVPIVLVGETTSQETSKVFRHGIISRIARSMRVDKIAEQVVNIMAELPERPGECSGVVGEATLDELVGLLSNELRSGVLSVHRKGDQENVHGARIVLRAGRAISEDVKSFVNRVKPIIAENEELSYRFDENSSGRVDSIRPPSVQVSPPIAMLDRRRILIVGLDRKKADKLAAELRSQKALVVPLCDLDLDLERARAMDPEVIVVDSKDIEGDCAETMEVLRQDLRMRWASILMYSKSQVWCDGSDKPNIDALADKILALNRPDNELRKRAEQEKSFDTRLEIIGPGRMLRVLAETNKTLRISLNHSRATIEIELQDKLISGVKGTLKEASPIPISGTTALAVFMALASGRVHVEELPLVQLTDLLSPLDLMLSLAAEEALPISPSIPPDSIIPSQIKLISTPPDKTDSLASSLEDVQKHSGSIASVSTKIIKDRPVELDQKKEVQSSKGNWWLGKHVTQAGVARQQKTIKGFEKAEADTQEVLVHQDLAVQEQRQESFDESDYSADLTDVTDDSTPDIDDVQMPKQREGMSKVVAATRNRMVRVAIYLRQLATACLVYMSASRLKKTLAFTKPMSAKVAEHGRESWSTLKRLLRFEGQLGERLRTGIKRIPKIRFAVFRHLYRSLYQRIAQSPRKMKIAIALVLLLMGALPTLAYWAYNSGDSQMHAQANAQMYLVEESVREDKKEVPEGVSINDQNPHQQEATTQENVDTVQKPQGIDETQDDELGLVLADAELTDEELEGDPEEDGSFEDEDALDEEGTLEDQDIDIDKPSGKVSNYIRLDRGRRIRKANKMILLGHRFWRQKRYGMAESYYLQSLKAYPQYPRAIVGLVRVHLARRASREAVRWAKKLVRRRPKPSLYRLLLGDAHALNGNLKEARVEWRIASRRGNIQARQRLRSSK